MGLGMERVYVLITGDKGRFLEVLGDPLKNGGLTDCSMQQEGFR